MPVSYKPQSIRVKMQSMEQYIRIAGIEEVQQDLEALAQQLKDASPLFTRLVDPIRRKFGQRFDSKGFGSWKKWAESTVFNVEGKHEPGTLMNRSGALRRSLMGGAETVLNIGPKHMHIGTKRKFAVILNDGMERSGHKSFGPVHAPVLRYFDWEFMRTKRDRTVITEGGKDNPIFRMKVGKAPSLYGRTAKLEGRPMVVASDHADEVLSRAAEWIWESPLFAKSTRV